MKHRSRLHKLEIDMPLLDFRRLRMVAETEREMATFLELFFETAKDILSEMEEAAHDGVLKQWKESAHALRGAAANIGSASLEQLCLKAERVSWIIPDSRDIMLQLISEEITNIRAFIIEQHPFLLLPEIKSCRP